MTGRPRTPATLRFWSKVEVAANGCWLWQAGCYPDGYGRFWADDQRNVRAHRWVWEQQHGAVPAGKELHHLCNTPICVNPAHLTPVTNRDNILLGNGLGARNARKTHCPKGHPYNDINTYTKPSTGRRYCRLCTNAHARHRRALRHAG